MKKTFTLISILLVSITGLWAQATPNSSFDNWTTTGFPSYSDPDNWESPNSQTAITSTFSCIKATAAADIHSGAAAVKLITKQIGAPFNQLIPGVVTTGTLPSSMTGSITGGIAYTLRPDSIAGWFKYTAPGGDNAFAEFMLFGSAPNNTDTIAKARFTTPTTTVSTYTRFSAPLVYFSNNAVANSIWLLGSSNDETTAVFGSTVFFDDIELIFNPVIPVNLSISSQTNVTCYNNCNGQATASATSGTSPYSYLWSNSQTTPTATGLCAGTFTVTVTDAASQTATSSVTITQPVLLTATATATNVTCNSLSDGTAVVTAGGGTTPYTYSWSNGFTTPTITGLTSGTYSVTVTDANGCTKNSSVSVTQPNAITVAASATDATCGGNNGTATVIAVGGTGTLTYLWSTGATTTTITGLAAGSYIVTATDANGCNTSASANVSNSGAPVASIATSTNVSCNGGSNGSATVSASGGASPYTYLWNTTPPQTTQTATGLAGGTYSVSVTDTSGVCPGIASVIITEPAVLSATTTSTPNSGSNNGTATVFPSGGTSPFSYSWNTTPPQTAETASGLATGSYSVTVTDANSCSVTSSVNIIYVGIQSQISNIISRITIYPNPAETNFFLVINDAKIGTYEIKISNIIGQVLFTGTFFHPGGMIKKEVDLKEIKGGLMLVQVITEDSNIVLPLMKME